LSTFIAVIGGAIGAVVQADSAATAQADAKSARFFIEDSEVE
jgi:hypothetical protein